jgi:hypothetical protein
LCADIFDRKIEREQDSPTDDWKHRVMGRGIVRAASVDPPSLQNDADDPADDGEEDEKRERDKGERRHHAALSRYRPENEPRLALSGCRPRSRTSVCNPRIVL